MDLYEEPCHIYTFTKWISLIQSAKIDEKYDVVIYFLVSIDGFDSDVWPFWHLINCSYGFFQPISTRVALW